MLSLNHLIELRAKRLDSLHKLANRKRELMERIDSVTELIQRRENDYNSICEAINRKSHESVPMIEIARFGLDNKGNMIYGGIISFPSISTKFYKIIDSIYLFDINPELSKFELHNKIREQLYDYLENVNYNDLIDFTLQEKKVIEKSIENMLFQKNIRDNAIPYYF